MTGCRCAPCRKANTDYAREREKLRADGDWNGLVAAAPARRHLRALSRRGVGYRQVADAACVSATVAFQIISGTKARVRARTAKRILEVTVAAAADHARVPAARTHDLVERLQREGFTKAELARRLGYKMPALQLTYSKTVLVRTQARIEKFYRQVMT